MSISIFKSKLLFEEIIKDEKFIGLSCGYEEKNFRYDALTNLIFEALPDFVLNESEKKEFSVTDSITKIRKAAKAVYSTEKYSKRGEFGEVLLHIILRDFYNSIPAVSKMYYKDGPNETVKGFDAVHIIPTTDGLEIWLGEVKFYNNLNRAIRDVIPEIDAHSKRDYLRSELMFISNKIDSSWSYANQLRDLIDEKVSLDKIIKKTRIPVLLTYDSTVVGNYNEVTEEFENYIKQELEEGSIKFRSNTLPDIEIHLVLLPLEDKGKLVDYLDEKLRVWQKI